MTLAPGRTVSAGPTDPQEDEDEVIKRRRPPTERPAVADLFISWSQGALGTATLQRAHGDTYQAALAERRADIYRRAAAMLADTAPAEAAQEMLLHARLAAVRTPPLLGFDEAGLSFVAARAWQLCAHTIDPTLPEVQPAWD